MTEDRELQAIESIYDALDRDDPVSALDLAFQARIRGGGEDPVLDFLAGRALFEMDRTAEAVDEFRRAVEQDGEDPEFRVYLAWSLFRLCRFRDAETESRRALELDDRLPEAHYVAGLSLERAGRSAEADRHFRRAAELEPEVFPRPGRFSDREFERGLDAARDGLREDFRRHLDQVTTIVEELPSESLLGAEETPLDPELLGLFVGVPLHHQDSLSPGGELPPAIYLFKRNLERLADGAEELEEQIRVTLYHELGHYLGLEEDDLDQLGYA